MKRRNNKKILKIIIGIILFILTLIVTYIILIIKGILPNPFLHTSYLTCNRINYISETTDGVEYTFKFDEKDVIIDYNIVYYSIYNNYEAAKKYYDNNKDSDIKINFIEDQNKIEFIYESNIQDNKQIQNKTKEEIRKIYVDEYYYECSEVIK